MRSRLFFLAATATLAAAPIAAAAGPEQAPQGWLSCGEISGPAGSTLWVEIHGAARCGTSRSVMASYNKRIRNGACDGQLCLIRFNGYRCTINIAAATDTSQRTIVASCSKGKRQINEVEVTTGD